MLANKDPAQIVIINGEDKSREIEKIEVLSSCVRIKFFKNSKVYTYSSDKIVIKNNYYENPDAKTVMKYFEAEANCSPIKIENQNSTILTEYLNRITQITDDVVLSYYVDKRVLELKKYNTGTLIYPFGINISQKKAVENAFLSPISIIQGPPGTGKTQTILNIIANAVIQDKSIAIVSNNNSAVANVAEKLKKYNLDFLLATLGSKQNKESFIEQQQEYPNLDSFKSEEPAFKLHRRITTNLQFIEQILKKQNELLELKQQRDALHTEHQHFIKNNQIDKNDKLKKLLSKLQSDKLFRIWAYCVAKTNDKQTFKNNFYFLFNLGISYLFLRDKDIFKQTNLLQKIFYENKLKELDKEIKVANDFLSKHNLSAKIKDMTGDSLALLKGFVYKRYHNKKRSMFSVSHTSNITQDFIKEYPVILSTLFSLKNTCKNGFVFDYLVVDEASQADLLTSAIAMSCAKNLIIVGDIKQLPNVITKEVEENSERILQNYNVKDAYKLHNHSLLSSVLALYPEAPNVLLQEHYRCHPKIIGFCNSKYYQNELLLFTENSEENDTLKAIKTNPGNHARGHVNQRQIDVIKKEVMPYWDKNLSIGIISPYRDQVEEIRECMGEEIEVDTIHKFQGREKDIIILSTVDNNITDFIDNPNLINVAVSRAVKKFWIVYSNENEKINSNLVDLINYIKYNNFEVVQSKVHSIFDLLYKRYTEERIKFLQKHYNISQYVSENIAFVCIKECLASIPNCSLGVIFGLPLKSLIQVDDSYTDEEKQFISRSSHVDFLIYNTINKVPVLAVEVDGYKFHKSEKQRHRGDLKDSILKKANLALLRLKTTGSGEEEAITNAIKNELAKLEQKAVK